MATESLSIRIPADLMAQVRTEMANSQATLTATVIQLLTAGMAAEAATALLNSRLEAADAEITRLQVAINSTSSATTIAVKADDGRADTGISVALADPRLDEPHLKNRETDRYAGIRAIVADRQRAALRGAAVGAALVMIAPVPMPYDWWFPQLIAQASMGGGSAINSGARLAGFDNGVEMLSLACPKFTRAIAEHEARTLDPKNKRQAAKSVAAKRKAGASTAKGQR